MVNMENVKLVNNAKFNEDKTNELLAGLKAEGLIVGVEDLGNYIRKQGLIVKEHIGRKRNYVEISPKVFGVDVNQKGDELKEFFKEHLQMGKIKFIPDSDEKKLINIEASIRMSRRRACIGYEDSFMPLETYKEFVKEVESKKKEYFEVRDSIVSRWDLLMKRFKEILWISLNELNSVDKEIVFNAICEKLPSKEDYANSFYITLSVKAFPVMDNLDMFDESIQSQIKEGLNQDTVATLYEIIGSTLNDAFENINKVLANIEKNRKLANKTLGAIKKTAERIAQKNIFNNPKVDLIKNNILEMVRQSHDIDEMAEIGENTLAVIYGYAKELGIESQITSISSSTLTIEELLGAYESMEEYRQQKLA